MWLAGEAWVHWTPPPPAEELFWKDVVRANHAVTLRTWREGRDEQVGSDLHPTPPRI